MSKVGVVEVEGGYSWACGCGASGTPTPDREAAREAFKEHRQSCTAATKPATTEAAPQQKTTPTPPGGATKMTTVKRGGAKKTASKKDTAKPRERAVSEKEALSVIEKIKADKSTVMAEARRLGCYHATLRKALRAAIGESAYAKLMSGKKAAKKAPVKKAAKKPAKKAPKSRELPPVKDSASPGGSPA